MILFLQLRHMRWRFFNPVVIATHFFGLRCAPHTVTGFDKSKSFTRMWYCPPFQSEMAKLILLIFASPIHSEKLTGLVDLIQSIDCWCCVGSIAKNLFWTRPPNFRQLQLYPEPFWWFSLVLFPKTQITMKSFDLRCFSSWPSIRCFPAFPTGVSKSGWIHRRFDFSHLIREIFFA